jgi:hypothetical protein
VGGVLKGSEGPMVVAFGRVSCWGGKVLRSILILLLAWVVAFGSGMIDGVEIIH